MKVLYIGSSGTLSLLPLHRIAASRHTLVAAGVDAALPDEGGKLIAMRDGGVESFARQHGLPVLDLARTPGDCARRIERLDPDIIITSCYARRIADDILRVPRLGAYNLHPSLLPAYRGPMPVFWQLRDNLDETGVTLHRMSDRLDAGDIAVQRTVAIGNELEYENILLRLADAGSQLILQLLDSAERGAKPPAIPQNEQASSYQPFPDADAFVLPASWSAQRMFRFIRRTRALGHLYRYEADGIELPVKNAISWSHATAERPRIQAGSATIPCSDGSIRVELAGLHHEKP